MSVRNFWLTVQIDGKEKEIETGPRGKDGGFSVNIKMRGIDGQICNNEIKINGVVEQLEKGKRKLRVYVSDTKNTIPYLTVYNDEV